MIFISSESAYAVKY